MNVHPHSLRLLLSKTRWLPVLQDSPQDSSPGKMWKRMDLVTKAVLWLFLDRVQAKPILQEAEQQQAHVLVWDMPKEGPQLRIADLAKHVCCGVRRVRLVLAQLRMLGLVQYAVLRGVLWDIALPIERVLQLITWNRDLWELDRTWCGNTFESPTWPGDGVRLSHAGQAT